ncbi:MAG: hypothetical protein V8R80_04915 [Eubacterium sp.]
MVRTNKNRARTAQNRFCIQAMECNMEDPSGNPSEATTQRYVDLAKGEAGLITLEAITVTRESRARDNQLTIMPQNEKPLTKFMDRVHEANPKSLVVFQLTHSGELSNPGFSRRVTPNPLPGYGGDLLSEDDVAHIMDEFVLAAKIAYNCGADGIDLKLCHGYFGSQMIRPHNDRKWKYGGSWENRTRFPYELMERIRKEIPDKNFLIGSKISAWEGFPGGFGTEGTALSDHGSDGAVGSDQRIGGERCKLYRTVSRKSFYHGKSDPGRSPCTVFCIFAPVLGKGI